MKTDTKAILLEIEQERLRQDKKFGADRKDTIPKWLMILGEEYGEACKAGVEHTYAVCPGIARNELLDCRTELIQVAAVAAAIVQSIDNHILPYCESAVLAASNKESDGG